jgi:sugar lactone lactonase YvrE
MALLAIPALSQSQPELTRHHDINQTTLSTIPYGIISTIAGTGYAGYGGIGGLATQSDLNDPHGVAVDSLGNVYIADASGNQVLKIAASTGDISIFAGSLEYGYSGDGGLASKAHLFGPTSLAFDKTGNLYIADSYNKVIRKVDAKTGIIATIAGIPGPDGSPGDGGPATKAKFELPSGIAVDSSGNLFITDLFACTIRRVDATTGIITTVAGGGFAFPGDGGPATAANIVQPTAVTVDSFGNLYISDRGDALLRRVDALTGVISTVAGSYTCNFGSCLPKYGYSGDGGLATAAELYCPEGVALDALANIYFSDSCDFAVRKIDATTGIISTIAGNPIQHLYQEISQGGNSGDGGPASSAELGYPDQLTFDNTGNLLFADQQYSVIRKVTLPRVAATAPPIFSIPGGIYSSGQTVAISTATPGATIYLTADGSVPTTASTKYSTPFKVAKDVILAAFATSPNLANSLVEAATFGVMDSAIISPGTGTYNTQVTANISSDLPGVLNWILETTDGSTPTINSPGYYGPLSITLTKTTTIKAANVATNGLTGATTIGPVTTATFTIKPQVAPPSFTPAVGSYATAQTITLADATPGSGIFYTTNGAAPTTSSTRYIKPIPVTATTNFRAIAVAAGENPSPIVSGKFTIQPLPIPTTGAATALTSSTATVHGSLNLEGAEADYWFVYGFSATTMNTQTPAHTLALSTTAVPVSAPLLELTTKTKYFFQLVTANSSGSAKGAVLSFTTN